MGTIKLNYHDVEKIFEEGEHQQDVCVELYKLVFPDWHNITKIDGWPTVHKETQRKLFRLWQDFDLKHHPNVMAGGLWLNNGFSTLKGDHLDLWEVDMSTVEGIIYEQGPSA